MRAGGSVFGIPSEVLAQLAVRIPRRVFDFCGRADALVERFSLREDIRGDVIARGARRGTLDMWFPKQARQKNKTGRTPDHRPEQNSLKDAHC
jgi:hypothetical protein